MAGSLFLLHLRDSQIAAGAPAPKLPTTMIYKVTKFTLLRLCWHGECQYLLTPYNGMNPTM
jgi:hypothetical protein